MTHDHLKTFIDSAYEHAVEITPETKGVVRDAVEEVLDLLDKGELRVAEKRDGALGGASMAEEGDPALLPPQRAA